MKPYAMVSSPQDVAYITERVCGGAADFSLTQLTASLRDEIPLSGGYKAGAIFKKKADSLIAGKDPMSKEEFRVLMETTMSHLLPALEDFDELFQRVDIDRSGCIDVDELAAFLGDPRIRLHRRLCLSLDTPI